MRNSMLLIFDFDGTLCNSLPRILHGVRHVFDRCNIPAPGLADYILGLRFPYLDFYRERGITISEEDIHDLFTEAASKVKTDLFPDVAQATKRLSAKGNSLAIVSGNNLDRVSDALAAADILDRFALVYGGCESKVRAIASVTRKLGFIPEDALVIGDSMIDITHAKQAGIRSIGIIRYPELDCIESQLIGAGAAGCIRALSELDDFIAKRSAVSV